MSNVVSLYFSDPGSSETRCFFPYEVLFNILRRLHVPELLRLTQTCTSAHKDIFANKTLVRRILVRETQGLAKRIDVERTRNVIGFIIKNACLCPDDIGPMQREEYLLMRGLLEIAFQSKPLELFHALPSVAKYYKQRAEKNLTETKQEAYKEGTQSDFARIMRSAALLQIFKLELKSDRKTAIKTLADIEDVSDLCDFKGRAMEILFYHDLQILNENIQKGTVSIEVSLQNLLLSIQSISNQKYQQKARYAFFKLLCRIDFNRAKETALSAEGAMRNKMVLKIIEIIAEDDSELAKKKVEKWFSTPEDCQTEDPRIPEQYRDLAFIRVCCGKAKKKPEEALADFESQKNNEFREVGYLRLSHSLPKDCAVTLLREKLSAKEILRDQGFYKLSQKLPLNEATALLVQNLSVDYFRINWEKFLDRQVEEIGLTPAFLSIRKIESLPIRINALLGFYKFFYAN